MTRTSIWLWITVSGIIYQGGRLIFGLETTPMTLFSGAYWAAAALGLHWYINEGRNEV